jgi:hypothetical protein
MSVVEQFPYRDRKPASGGLDLMPDLPILLRHQSNTVSGVGLVDSGTSISVLPYSLGQFNFFLVFDICFFRARRIFEIRQAGVSGSP